MPQHALDTCQGFIRQSLCGPQYALLRASMMDGTLQAYKAQRAFFNTSRFIHWQYCLVSWIPLFARWKAQAIQSAKNRAQKELGAQILTALKTWDQPDVCLDAEVKTSVQLYLNYMVAMFNRVFTQSKAARLPENNPLDKPTSFLSSRYHCFTEQVIAAMDLMGATQVSERLREHLDAQKPLQVQKTPPMLDSGSFYGHCWAVTPLRGEAAFAAVPSHRAVLGH